MGVTYMAVAAEHPLAKKSAAENPDVAAFIEDCKKTDAQEATLETMEKRGMPLSDTDLMIASTALANDLVLITGNERHFTRINDLQVENWLKN